MPTLKNLLAGFFLPFFWAVHNGQTWTAQRLPMVRYGQILILRWLRAAQCCVLICAYFYFIFRGWSYAERRIQLGARQQVGHALKGSRPLRWEYAWAYSKSLNLFTRCSSLISALLILIIALIRRTLIRTRMVPKHGRGDVDIGHSDEPCVSSAVSSMINSWIHFTVLMCTSNQTVARRVWMARPSKPWRQSTTTYRGLARFSFFLKQSMDYDKSGSMESCAILWGAFLFFGFIFWSWSRGER